ncbi:isochorismatase family cysteine hydrolase [Billgrantia endophytica]|uniref:Cysteine hydrolase n=1 Tax=Billgrantia endophytica TaxID=2033802 RepID=A0A2N7UAE7_9GAMM|nr:isochorismatase family cysteine hydrolase [Halomonas endophytica]PMR77418.1 cysteine hydrolase [Halomonas endophytica]
MTTKLSREVPVEPNRTALLFIDVQNFCAHPEGMEFADLSSEEFTSRLDFYFQTLRDTALPNMRQLQSRCREAGIEVMYTVIESLTRDGRDRSLDYKITGFNVLPGSWDARVLEEMEPLDDEIVIPKTSSSVFISTNIDYVLRNLGVRHLILAGVVTDQCIESAVRDACDLGYLVTLIPDACTTYTQERHDASLKAIKGYCRMRTTAELIRELPLPGR